MKLAFDVVKTSDTTYAVYHKDGRPLDWTKHLQEQYDKGLIKK